MGTVHACSVRVWRSVKTTWAEGFRVNGLRHLMVLRQGSGIRVYLKIAYSYPGALSAAAFSTRLARALHVSISTKRLSILCVCCPAQREPVVGWLWCAAGRVWMVVLLPRLKSRAGERMHVLNRWVHLLLRRAAAATRLPICPAMLCRTRGFHRYQSECFNLALSHAHGQSPWRGECDAQSFLPAPCP